jgi:two-component system response regulator PilR (NtrC family)
MSAQAKPVLVVDDEADIRDLLEMTLGRMGLEAVTAGSVREARACIARGTYSLCLTDMRLPDGEGLELVALLAEVSPGTPVAVITAHGSAENAVAALKAGAFDYLSKPVSLAQLRDLVKAALRLQGSVVGRGGRAEPDGSPALNRLVGSSPRLQQVREMIGRLGRSQAPVYVTGESGTGKELAARAIHGASARVHGPFIGVNCGAIPENLMESEFFGYRKGAFTGAAQDRDGFFHAAHGGTLFLDEVADLPLQMQVKLLRVIQEKKVRRVGDTAEENVDVRIISATHQTLGDLVQSGRFRQDLYYRLNVIELRMPSLREMPEDVPGIARTLLQRLGEEAGVASPPLLAPDALQTLQSYPFPGNVRELENLLERAMALCNGREIRTADLLLGDLPAPADTRGADPGHALERRTVPPEAREAPLSDAAGGARAEAQYDALNGDGDPLEGPAPGSAPVRFGMAEPLVDPRAAAGMPDCPLPEYLDLVERRAIEAALMRTRFNKTAAARLLGITFRALRYRMERLGIE